MSDIEHSEDLAVLPNYNSIKAGMEIITENAVRLGRIISIDNKSHSGSSRVLFVDSIHPLLNFCSSIYEIPAVSIVTIGNNRIIIGGDVIPEIVETRVGILRSLGLVDSLNTKIERRKPSYRRLATHNQSYCKRSAITLDNSIDSPEVTLREQIDWANDGWEYNLNPIDRHDDIWGDNMDWNDDDPNNWDNNNDDDDLPGASVLRPKKPNPNLPPSLMLVDEDRF
jgi:sporulation protein YlmC with PRC-barrel domain